MIAPIKLIASDATFRAKFAIVCALPLDEFFIDGATLVSWVGHLATL